MQLDHILKIGVELFSELAMLNYLPGFTSIIYDGIFKF